MLLETQTCRATPAPWQPLAQQQIFRQLMSAFAYPGRCQTLTTGNQGDSMLGDPALIRVLAALLDTEVGLADPDGLVTADDSLRLEARRMEAERAHFVLARGERAPDFQPCLGTLESPEGGATVILRVRKLGVGARLLLKGPGIQGQTAFAVTGLDPAWLAARDTWNASFPMGVDLLLVDDTQVAAIPRTTRIQIQGEH